MKIKYILLVISALVLTSLAGLSQSLDTTGLSGWNKMYNSTASWEEGAFGYNQTGHPDYGWGIYNMLTHYVTADSFHIIKLLNGEYNKLWIVEKNSGANIFTFKYAALDGSNEVSEEIDNNDYSDVNFIDYSLSDGQIVENEPPADSWDLLLTKFHHQEMNYVVTGFLANEGVEVSVYEAPDSLAAAGATLADNTEFTDSIAAIGNSWYRLSGMSMQPLDTMVYFLKKGDSAYYKMQVTFFESGYSGQGRVGIRTQLLGDTPGEVTNDTLVMGAMYANEVYFSLAGGDHVHVPRDNWEIAFKTEQFSSSVRANIASGVELYTYPAELSAWEPSSVTTPGFNKGGTLKLFPVPAGEDLFISWEKGNNDPYDISLYDLTGKMILEHPVAGRQGTDFVHLDISTVKTGLYIIRVQSNNATEVQRLLVK
jgi:hypothetical protein